MNHEAWSEAQSSQTVEVDGHDVEMAYYEAGAGETVVFLHGIPTWSFLWRDAATDLEDDYHVVAPDLVGYGNSAAHEGFDRSIRAQEQALSDLLDALDVETCTLVAHDIGGGVALRFAAHQPERVEKLVCSNVVCYDSWPVEFIVNMGLPKTEAMDPAEFEAKLDFAFDDGAFGEADPEFVAGMKAPWLREGGQRALARAAVSTNTNHTTEIDYGAISAELLCLWAAADQMQPIAYGERLAEELDGDLQRLDDAYHWVPEDRKDVYADRVREFLAGDT
ncbi:alpha/beta fold hydrolase [Natronomonas sp. EA1]|uniref:alpha/beta fold hydrolase n=1 Tax=Natronomonas sp. EA1 TaxID=3421655 RepID=UPI003EB8CBE2